MGYTKIVLFPKALDVITMCLFYQIYLTTVVFMLDFLYKSLSDIISLVKAGFYSDIIFLTKSLGFVIMINIAYVDNLADTNSN